MGLWLARRWGEYFAMVATSLGLPVEIYDLSHKVTVTALIFLAVNLALVAVPGGHQAAVRRPGRQARLRGPPAQRLRHGDRPSKPPPHLLQPSPQLPRQPPHHAIRPAQPSALASHLSSPATPATPADVQLHRPLRPLRPPQPRSAPPPRQAPTPRHSSPPMATEPHRAHLPRPTRTPLRSQPPRRTRQPASPLLPRAARAHDPVVDVPLPTPGGTRRDIHKRSPPRLGRM